MTAPPSLCLIVRCPAQGGCGHGVLPQEDVVGGGGGVETMGHRGGRRHPLEAARGARAPSVPPNVVVTLLEAARGAIAVPPNVVVALDR